MDITLEVVLTIIGLSFWFLFPIGMFLSISRIDKNTDQIVRLEKYREEQEDKYQHYQFNKTRHRRFDWHHPVLHFKRWLNQP